MSFVPIKCENCVIKKAEQIRRNLEKEKIPGKQQQQKKRKKKTKT